jgi:hypothetical protein
LTSINVVAKSPFESTRADLVEYVSLWASLQKFAAGEILQKSRHCGEVFASLRNLWNPKRMGSPATDEVSSPASTGARRCGVATTTAFDEEAIDHCRR